MKNFDLSKNLFNFLQNILDIDLEHDLVFIKDYSLNYVYVNNTFSQLFDMTPAEIVGKKDEDLFYDKTTLESCYQSDLYALEHDYISHEETAFNQKFKVLKLKINLGNNKIGILCFAKQNPRKKIPH